MLRVEEKEIMCADGNKRTYCYIVNKEERYQIGKSKIKQYINEQLKIATDCAEEQIKDAYKRLENLKNATEELKNAAYKKFSFLCDDLTKLGNGGPGAIYNHKKQTEILREFEEEVSFAKKIKCNNIKEFDKMALIIEITTNKLKRMFRSLPERYLYDIEKELSEINQKYQLGVDLKKFDFWKMGLNKAYWKDEEGNLWKCSIILQNKITLERKNLTKTIDIKDFKPYDWTEHLVDIYGDIILNKGVCNFNCGK